MVSSMVSLLLTLNIFHNLLAFYRNKETGDVKNVVS